MTLVVFLTACGPSDRASFPTEVPATAAPSPEISLFEELLGTIPDTLDTRKSVMINNYAALREILAMPPSGPDAGLPALVEYLYQNLDRPDKTAMTPGPFISGIHQEGGLNPRREYLAFDGRNVDQSVESGVAPAILEVAWGRFDPPATAQALASCTECPQPDTETYNDVLFYSWGEDGEGKLRDRRNPPAFDFLGRGGRIAVTNDYVYRTIETPGMKKLIDSRNGGRDTLADVEEFSLLAQAMSRLDTYTAFFSNQTYKVSTAPDQSSAFDPEVFRTFPDVYESKLRVYENLKEEIGDSTLLLPYLAFSTGAGKDDIGPYVALALVHSDMESAEENAERLRNRIAESSDYPKLQVWKDALEESTFRVEGRVLSAMMRGDGPTANWKLLTFIWGIPPPLIPHE